MLSSAVEVLCCIYKGFPNFLIVSERNSVIGCRVVGGLPVHINLYGILMLVVLFGVLLLVAFELICFI